MSGYICENCMAVDPKDGAFNGCLACQSLARSETGATLQTPPSGSYPAQGTQIGAAAHPLPTPRRFQPTTVGNMAVDKNGGYVSVDDYDLLEREAAELRVAIAAWKREEDSWIEREAALTALQSREEVGRVSVPNDAASYPRDNALEVARSMEIAVIAWKAAHGNETLKHPDQSLLARSFLAVASELTWRDQLSAAPAPAATTGAGEVGVYVENVDDKDAAMAEFGKLVDGAASFSGKLPILVENGLCIALTGTGPLGMRNAYRIADALNAAPSPDAPVCDDAGGRQE